MLQMSKMIDEVDNMQELQLVNYDGGDLANHFMTDEVIWFDFVICVWNLKSKFSSFDISICNTRWFTRMGS